MIIFKWLICAFFKSKPQKCWFSKCVVFQNYQSLSTDLRLNKYCLEEIKYGFYAFLKYQKG